MSNSRETTGLKSLLKKKLEIRDYPNGIERRVCEDIARRQQQSIPEYGRTLEAARDAGEDILKHAYFEALDLSIYLRGELEKQGRI